MSITITELEMSLDASNKGNAQLQNTCKIQNEKIMQLTSAYEDVNRKMGASVQQYDVTIKKLTELDVSYKKITADYNKSLTIIKDYELKLNGFNGKVGLLHPSRKVTNILITGERADQRQQPAGYGEDKAGEGVWTGVQGLRRHCQGAEACG